MNAICNTKLKGKVTVPGQRCPQIQFMQEIRMILKFFDTNGANAFGESLADFFMKEIPLIAENKKINKGELKKQFKAIEVMHARMNKYRLENDLNFYKKAKLGAAFKNRLIAAGYDAELVDFVTKQLLV